MRDDRRINNQRARVIQNSEEKITKWKNIKVGQIVEVRKDEEIPADMLLIYAEDHDGVP